MSRNNSIEVNYSIHPNLTNLVSAFFLTFGYPNIDPNDRTVIAIPLPPESQGTLFLNELLPNETVVLRLNSSIGGTIYLTPTIRIVTPPEVTLLSCHYTIIFVSWAPPLHSLQKGRGPQDFSLKYKESSTGLILNVYGVAM